MRRNRRNPVNSPEAATQQAISQLQATPPGWKNLQTADGGKPLRIIRGRVHGNGTIAEGGGFTATSGGGGFVTVNFSTAFSSAPTVTVSMDYSAAPYIAQIVVSTLSTTQVQFVCTTPGGIGVNNWMYFIAIGPA